MPHWIFLIVWSAASNWLLCITLYSSTSIFFALNIGMCILLLFSPHFLKFFNPNFPLGGVWGRYCRAWWNTQPGWGVETQLHHLHCVKVLVLPHLVCYLWHPCCSALGLPVCMHILLPHLGCGSLHQELSDWVSVHQPHLLSLHPDLLRSLLWSPGQDLQQCARCTAQRSLSTHTVFIIWCHIFLYTTSSVLASCLLPDPPPFITCCSPPSQPWADMPSVISATRSSVTAAAGSMAPWQLWHSWKAQCSSVK